MFLNLIKIVVKNTLHKAAEEWAEELGLPEPHLVKMRERRLALAEEALRESMNQFRSYDASLNGHAAEIDVTEDSDPQIGDESQADSSGSNDGPATVGHESLSESEEHYPETTEIDDDFMNWVHQQRLHNMPWAVIATLASQKGVSISENALAKRYHRWCQQDG